jgi:hypothetical protein
MNFSHILQEVNAATGKLWRDPTGICMSLRLVCPPLPMVLLCLSPAFAADARAPLFDLGERMAMPAADRCNILDGNGSRT